MRSPKKRGCVRISLETMAKILCLRDGLTVTGASYDLSTETIEIALAGEELMPTARRCAAACYRLADLTEED